MTSAPTIDFRSDNVASVAPEIMEAVRRANAGPAASYGNDADTQALQRRFSDLFETKVRVVPVATGTAANAISIATLTPPYGAVFCHEQAHIETTEVGATEFFSGGAKLTLLPGANGRFGADALAAAVAGSKAIGPKPSAVSVTQATETGTLYRLDELRAIGAVARAHGLRYHMDGARFANALATLDCSPAEMTWRAGVDILSFGVTKNGGLSTDAIVVFAEDLVEDLSFRLRRAGQTWSKMRFAAAQLAAYVEDDRYIAFAKRANGLATRLANGLRSLPGARILAPVEANEVFAALPDPVLARLTEAGFLFITWAPGVARFVCRFDGQESEVDALISATAAELSAHEDAA